MDKQEFRVKATAVLKEIGAVLEGSIEDYPETQDPDLLTILFSYPRNNREIGEVVTEIQDELGKRLSPYKLGWIFTVVTNSNARSVAEAEKHPFKIDFIKAN